MSPFNYLSSSYLIAIGDGRETLPEIPAVVANTPSALFLFVALNYTF